MGAFAPARIGLPDPAAELAAAGVSYARKAQDWKTGDAAMARKKGFRIPGLSFSWKRAVGLTQLKSKVSRKIGVPLTKAGRKRKVEIAVGEALGEAIGSAVGKGAGKASKGCCIPAMLIAGSTVAATVAAGYGIASII